MVLFLSRFAASNPRRNINQGRKDRPLIRLMNYEMLDGGGLQHVLSILECRMTQNHNRMM